MLSIIKFQFSIRKEHIKRVEQEEAIRLKEMYQSTKAQHSVVSDFVKLMKWRFLKYAIYIFGVYFSYQIYATADIFYDGKIRVLPLRKEHERTLADQTIGIIRVEKGCLRDESLENRVKPHSLLLLDEEYPIFNLLPNDYLIANKRLLQRLSDHELQLLLDFCKLHNESKLDLSYIPTLTLMKIMGFRVRNLSQIVMAKEYFFLSKDVPPNIVQIMKPYANLEQGAFSFILQHNL